MHSPRCILKRTTCDFLVIRSRCGKLSSLISWLYVPVVGNSAHSRYGKSRNCVWSEGAVGNALSRDSRYFLAFAITGNRGERFLGIPTLGRENFFIRERQLFSETKVNNKSPLQSLLFIIDQWRSVDDAQGSTNNSANPSALYCNWLIGRRRSAERGGASTFLKCAKRCPHPFQVVLS